MEDLKKVEERQAPEEKENTEEKRTGARGRKRLGDLGLARGEQQEF